MQMNSPKEIIDLNISGAVNKANLKLSKMIALGILAGMFIAVGGVTSNTVVHTLTNLGLSRALAGSIFPIGLLMIVLVGGELFTGNCLMIMAAMDRQIRVTLLLRNLIVVFFSNLAGSLIMDVLIFFSGNLDYSDGGLGAYTIKVALNKATIDPFQGVISGMLCNFLVCMAILKGAAAQEAAGKIMATWFPIFAFVANGFEHIVANMYYIPIGILAATNPVYTEKAKELYGITATQLDALDINGVLNNFIPVTIGNVLGGMFVGFMLYFINVKCDKK
ncbi:MAG: formate/nitrite transporter family protein [Bacteroidales bacterium]|nr:formate/nitrite transporter family protein [Clostridium sp.]MCM1202800.1 formate/nitrite transporter family protein [Bacteroidales bacterium]